MYQFEWQFINSEIFPFCSHKHLSWLTQYFGCWRHPPSLSPVSPPLEYPVWAPTQLNWDITLRSLSCGHRLGFTNHGHQQQIISHFISLILRWLPHCLHLILHQEHKLAASIKLINFQIFTSIIFYMIWSYICSPIILWVVCCLTS